MTSSLEALLALVEGDVPEYLISADAFAALRTVCRVLPIEISSGIGFESRLAEKSAQADLLLLAYAPRGLEILAGIDPFCRVPDNFFEDVYWQRLRALAVDWQTWPKRLREAVLAVWLEFDEDQFASPVPRPSLLFLESDKRYRARYFWDELARRVYSTMRNSPIKPELAAVLGACLGKIPNQGIVFSLGVGISRPTKAIRLVLKDLTFDDVLNYLSSISWAGDLREMKLLLQDLGRYVSQFNLSIDIETSVRPKIGIECSFGGEEQSARRVAWTDFLKFATSKGWCLQEKSDGLLEWPGLNWFQAGNEPWPWAVERFLGHVKIGCDAVSGVEAKAYFGLIWRRASMEGVRVRRVEKGEKP
jgi:hypothetical protein